MADNPTFEEPTGSADQRLANLQNLEDGEQVKQEQMKWVDGANYGMLGADVGFAAYAGGAAAIAEGAAGAAALGAGALAAAPAIIAVGGAYALDKFGVTGWMTNRFVGAGDALGLTIGRGGSHPACVGDAVAHSSGFWGIVGGLAVGVAIGALVAATVATGGLLGVVLAGAALAGGLSLGSALAAASQSMGSDCGRIMTGSGNVFFEGKKVARVTDLVQCDQHSGPQSLVEGSRTVFVNGLPLVRIGHDTHCSGKINSGRNSILIDKTTGQYGPKNPELSALQELIAGLVGGIAGGAIGSAIHRGLRSNSTRSAERKGIDEETRPKCKDPIDPVSGEMVEIRTDLSIPGVLPLELKRRYRTRSNARGLLGKRCSDTWSQRLTLTNQRFVYFDDGAGLEIGFDAPQMALDGINLTAPRYRLVGSRLEPRLLDREARELRIFSPLVENRPSRLERIEDLDGNTITFVYDRGGRLAGLTHSDGYRLELLYHARDVNPESIVLHEATGNARVIVRYGYRDGLLAKVDSYQFGQFIYEYDSHGWMTRWADSDQTDVRYLYDDAGRVIETGTREGYHTGRFVYEAGLTRVIDADGERLFAYDADGMVIAETDPLGASTCQEWTLGRLTAKTDALGRRTVYRYTDDGLLAAAADPTGRTLRFEYDDAQQLTAAVQPDGSAIRLEYDHLRHLVARTEPDGMKTQYRYGARGELLRIVQGDRETRLDYDTHHRLRSFRLPTGAVFLRHLDIFGRVLTETDPSGNVTHFDYRDGSDNPRGDLSTITRADGTTTHIRYNSEGLAVETIDPLGKSHHRSYGPFDLLMATTDAAGYTTHFEYDHATRLSRVINALGETYTYRYDAAGRLIETVDWGGRVTHYERDVCDRLVTKVLADGGRWRYTYDVQDRLVELDAGDVRLVYRYDSLGRLASAAVEGSSTHVVHFAYDALGRIVGEEQHGELLRHVYDTQGQRCLRITPHRETRYGYDTLGELRQIGALTVERDSRGREVGRHAGDFVALQQFDMLGLLQRQIAGPRSAIEAMQSDPVAAFQQLSRQIYRYDAAGRLAQLETGIDAASYQRDSRGLVTSVEHLLQPPEHYSYDAAMNLAAHGERAAVDVHQYERGALPERVGHARYRYDARGRTIEKTVDQPGFRSKTWQYTWDGLNRLVKVVTPERSVWVYDYDAFNRRIAKRLVGGRGAVRFLWDGPTIAERWVEQRDGTTGHVVTWHIEPGTFTPFAQETEAGIYPILTDQVGMPKALFDTQGNAVWKGAHSLWGKLRQSRRAANDAAGTKLDTTLRFPGQWADDESGLHYNLNRYYDPDSGQYLSIDPIGLEGGLRTQGYVRDPLQMVDVLGLQPCLPKGKKITMRAYRYERPDRIGTTWTTHPGNIASGHRYTKEGVGGVYGADSQATALAEVNHYKVDLSTRELVTKDVTLNNVLDLTDPKVRDQLGVKLEDITGDSYTKTHELGDMAIREGYDGILAPSARNPDGANLISFAGW
ncbi:RES domain-containing protein [Burkholderia cepacia]|uniref:RHS repeat-associated core domain-containing protein n=1 Tax=Burkholderia cepacia TaxID=292 RepID=UPI001CF48395|nr:RHS repeat-associated core domain-containing protein [Burkholderia cepacia]MCA7978121.1 RES domain-containing protein [Burkholderia cepacia]